MSIVFISFIMKTKKFYVLFSIQENYEKKIFFYKNLK